VLAPLADLQAEVFAGAGEFELRRQQLLDLEILGQHPQPATAHPSPQGLGKIQGETRCRRPRLRPWLHQGVSRRWISTTAWQAMPSRRPSNPRPSVVVPLMLILSRATPRSLDRLVSMAL